MRTKTISELEKGLTNLQIREARARTIEQLDGHLALSRGLSYISSVLIIYKEKLEDEYNFDENDKKQEI